MDPYFQNNLVTLYHGDSREVMPTISGVSAIVTDPPYEIGFMGSKWDKSRIAFDLGFWWLLLRSCLPGAHLLSFGGSRTFHRIACAIEDAGWEYRDTIMWITGMGFPKSLDVGKQLPEWQGYGTNLKPAYEAVILARKKLCGTVAQNVTEHGCGALNVDECRVEAETRPLLEHTNRTGKIYGSGLEGSKAIGTTNEGRWPANLIHDGSPEVLKGFPDSDGQQGDLVNHSKDRPSKHCYGDMKAARNFPSRMDSGSAARFFKECKPTEEEILWNQDPANIVKKTLTATHQTSADSAPKHAPTLKSDGCAKAITSESTSSNTVVGDLGFRSASRVCYTAKASGSERDDNTHPTVKPLALMEYLCRLIKQPTRNLVLDPFAGSGTTLLACELLGIKCIGIELEESHCEIIAKRFSKPAEPYLL